MNRLEPLVAGFMSAKVLLAAAELRVFDVLEPEGAARDHVADRIGGAPRPTEILLDALAALGVIDKDARGVYRNRDDHRAWLVGDVPYAAMLRHRNRLFARWARLEDVVRGAAPVLPGPSVLDDPAANDTFIRAMAHAAADRIPLVLPHLPLSQARVFADVGGGPARYIGAALDAHATLRALLLDLPLTIDVARRLATPALALRTDFVPWRFYDDPAPAGLPPIDVMLLSQVVHAESPERNRALLARLRDLLVPGGTLVIHENACDASRTTPLPAALFSINMLVGTEGGRSYTADEMEAWAHEAGFATERVLRLDERSLLLILRRA